MQNHSRRIRHFLRRTIPLLLTVAWIVFIFANSMQTGEESGSQSKLALAWLVDIFSYLGIPISLSELFLRKLAHFSEYAILGLLLSFNLWSFNLLSPLKNALVLLGRCLWAIPAATLFALIDEFVIQRLTPGRGPSIFDVLIDTAGAAVAVLLFFFVFWLFQRSQRAEKE